MPEPEWWHKVLCITGILGVQAGLNWMDRASNADLRFLLIGLALALVAGLVARRLNEGGMR